MDDLQSYLEKIVEPTFAEFGTNRRSERHAYLACVVAYHAIDRAAYKPGKSSSPGNLLQEWRTLSLEFAIVEMIALHLKHVRGNEESARANQQAEKKGIPLTSLVFRPGDRGETLGDLRNLYFVVQDAIRFLHSQVAAPEANQADKSIPN